MTTSPDIKVLQDRLDVLRRRLQYSLGQKATLGNTASFALIEDIRQARDDIAQVKAELRDAGAEVKDQADDETIQPTSPQERVTAGLQALTGLMHDPQVHDAVTLCGPLLENVREQLHVLGTYKDMHDELHRLQFECFNTIESESTRFPNDEQAYDNLTRYAVNFRGIVERLQSIIERSQPHGELQAEVNGAPIATSSFFSPGNLGWLNDLNDAQIALFNALENSDIRLLKRSIWLINRVLAVQPTRINERLLAVAEALTLNKLISALSYVRQVVAHPDTEAALAQQFADGLETITTMSRDLNQLVRDHNCWQAVEAELRLVDIEIRQDVLVFGDMWPRIEQRTEPFQDRGEPWAQKLRDNAERVNRAIAASEPKELRRSFLSYRQAAGVQFYAVDTQVKHRCDELRDLGPQIERMLRGIA